MGQFAASIEAWVGEVKGGSMAVAKQSIQDLVDLIKEPIASGGNMPIDTSFLQNSLTGSTENVPSLNPAHDASQPPLIANAGVIEALIANLTPGQTLHFGFTAIYALRQNYGFTGFDSLGRYYNQSGHFFVEHALGQWQEIVDKNAKRLSSTLAFG